MEVIINGYSFQWESDFLTEVRKTSQSKWFKKREDYFCFDTIGGTKCFIKRSENGFEGGEIFRSLVGQSSTAIPTTYGFGEVIENNKKVQYLITEFLQGMTLDVYLNKGKLVDMTRFAERLGDGIEFLHSLGYWHGDLNADNIMIADNGDSFIIDVDSCIENHIRPTHISNREGALTTLSNQLGSYALKYYKKFLEMPVGFEYSELIGTNLNYFQSLFLIYQVKYFQQQKKSNSRLIWKKSTFRGLEVEHEIRNANRQFADSLFKSALIKPLHKKIVFALAKDLVETSISTAPSVQDLKDMKELKELKVKHAELQNVVSVQSEERDKMLQEIHALKNAPKGNNGWTWFWGVAASLALIIGLVSFQNVKAEKDDYQSRYNSVYYENQSLQTQVSSLRTDKNQLNSAIQEFSKVSSPYLVSEIKFENGKNKRVGKRFRRSDLTYVRPLLNVVSLVDQEVEIRYYRYDKDYDNWSLPSRTFVKTIGGTDFHVEKFTLKKGTNDIRFDNSWGSDSEWARYSPYTFSFFIENVYVKSEKLSTY